MEKELYVSNNYLYPPLLSKGDTIGIAAPASPFDKAEFLKGVQTIESFGFKVQYRSDIFSRHHHYLAGNDERRLEELHELFADSKIKAILFARGGYGTQRILSNLDESLLRKNPKIVIGYSDLTSLLLYLHQKFGWIVFHGPVVAKGLGETFGERGKTSLLQTLTSPLPFKNFSLSECEWLKKGKMRGTLTGGCLSLLTASLGTPWEIETENRLLFIEDVNEKIYKIDRMLSQLKIAGKFQKITGLVCGPFTENEEDKINFFNLLEELFKNEDFPILTNFPSGHIDNLYTLPFGLEITFDPEQKRLEFA